MQALSQTNNAVAWREREHADLQDLMQRRLHYLQVGNSKQLQSLCVNTESTARMSLGAFACSRPKFLEKFRSR